MTQLRNVVNLYQNVTEIISQVKICHLIKKNKNIGNFSVYQTKVTGVVLHK